MKVAELSKILQCMDPELTVGFSLGRNHDEEYRRKCAKVELVQGDVLYFLDVDRIEIYPESNMDDSRYEIVLKQTNYPQSYFDQASKKFDDLYTKKENNTQHLNN